MQIINMKYAFGNQITLFIDIFFTQSDVWQISLEGSTTPIKIIPSFVACHPYDDFNSLCSYKPYKYENYDEAPHLVSSSTLSPKKTSSLVPQAELTLNYSLDKPTNNLMCRVSSKHLSGVGSTWCRRWSLSSN